jgi:hypothetical protein
MIENDLKIVTTERREEITALVDRLTMVYMQEGPDGITSAEQALLDLHRHVDGLDQRIANLSTLARKVENLADDLDKAPPEGMCQAHVIANVLHLLHNEAFSPTQKENTQS